jgi:hypothetical protein
VFEKAAPIQSPAKREVRSVIRFLNAKGERQAEIHKQIFAVCGNVMNFHLFLHLKNHLAGKTFDDDDDEVQEEVMTWFQDLINVWTMPATMLKNKVMYRQFIHCVVIVN